MTTFKKVREWLMEHRWGTRVRRDVPVKIICAPAAVGAGRLVNLSVSGGFVKSALVPKLMAHVQLLADTGARPEQPFEALEGHVVRQTRSGFGLEWIELAPEAVCRLLHRPEPARAPAAESKSALRWSLHGGKRPIRRKSARSGRAGCPLARYERRDSQLPGSTVFMHKQLNY
jgi:PilZ domain-containing protein